jgi:hypothetical protein
MTIKQYLHDKDPGIVVFDNDAQLADYINEHIEWQDRNISDVIGELIHDELSYDGTTAVVITCNLEDVKSELKKLNKKTYLITLIGEGMKFYVKGRYKQEAIANFAFAYAEQIRMLLSEEGGDIYYGADTVWIRNGLYRSRNINIKVEEQ